MVKPEIISETPINVSILNDELEKIKKRDKELNFRANKTQEYLSQFSSLDSKKAKELYDKISKLNIPRLKDIHINKIIDILPTGVEDLKTLLQGYTISISDAAALKKIVEVVKEYAP